MANKYLTEREWKSFSKDPAYKDAALVKALAALDKAEKADPDEQLSALAEVEKQAGLLLKAHKGDKALVNHLGEMDKAGKKLRQEAQDAQHTLADKAEGDEPGSALLEPHKLLAQLNFCKRDPERHVQFAYVDGHDKQAAVMAMSPKMGGRKMFTALQSETGVKSGAFGTAWIDDNSLMLQLDKPLAGLVKKARAPVRACGFRIARIVLWNADGTVFEQDDDGQEPAATATGAAPASAIAATAEPAPSAAYEARLAMVKPQVDQAVAAQHPAAAKMLPVMSFAATKAAAGDFAGALRALDAVEKMLATAPAAVGAKVAFTQARLAWDQTRTHVQAELHRLQQKLLAECRSEPDIADITQNSDIVFTVLTELDRHDKALIDELDEALNAQTPEARQGFQRQAAARIGAYRDYVQTDTLVRDVQDNGFEDVSIVGPVNQRLTLMAAQLQAVAAL